VLFLARPAAAQSDPGSFYFAGGVTVSMQEGPSGESSETYVTAPGGTTAGWLVGGGVFVTRAISVEAEWARAGVALRIDL
jgi:hypothetical protein